MRHSEIAARICGPGITDTASRSQPFSLTMRSSVMSGWLSHYRPQWRSLLFLRARRRGKATARGKRRFSVGRLRMKQDDHRSLNLPMRIRIATAAFARGFAPARAASATAIRTRAGERSTRYQLVCQVRISACPETQYSGSHRRQSHSAIKNLRGAPPPFAGHVRGSR